MSHKIISAHTVAHSSRGGTSAMIHRMICYFDSYSRGLCGFFVLRSLSARNLSFKLLSAQGYSIASRARLKAVLGWMMLTLMPSSVVVPYPARELMLFNNLNRINYRAKQKNNENPMAGCTCTFAHRVVCDARLLRNHDLCGISHCLPDGEGG